MRVRMPKIIKVSELLMQRTRDKPTRVFITDLNRQLSLTNAQTASYVNCMLESWGAQKQVMLAFMTGGAPDALIWLAALAGGHELIPLSPETPLQNIEEIVQMRHATMIIGKPTSATTGWSIGNITRFKFDLKTLRQTPAKEWQALSAAPDNGQVVLSTSGSTGKPKQLVLSADQLITSAQQIVAAHQLSSDDRGMTVLPLFHINAPVVSLLTSLVSNSEVMLAKKHSSGSFWEWVECYQPTWISLVPAVAIMLLQIPKPAREVIASVRFVRSASAPLAAATLQHFETTFGLPLIETYGISEAAATIASNPLPPAPHKAGSVGQPVPGIEMRICIPRSLNTVKHGVIGEVCIKGRTAVDHYEANRGSDSFQEGWLRTGDLGYFDADNYLFLVGRSKDIIIRGGENIFPVEIEAAILEQPWVHEVAVVGRPDPVYGEAIVAFVGTSQSKPKQQQLLQEYLGQRLPRNQQPSEIRFVVTLPKTSSNKIDKVALREVVNRVP